MDGAGNAAHVAACIVQKDWDMLRGILAAVRDVPAPRLAEFICEATQKVPEE